MESALSVFLSFGSHSYLAPIERVQILLQTKSCNNEALKRGIHFKGIFSTFSMIYKKEGFTSLWRGNSINVLKSINSVTIGYGLYNLINYLNPFYSDLPSASTTISKLGSTLVAGLISSAMVFPIEVGRVRAAADFGPKNERQFRGPFKAISQIYKQNGWRHLFRGFVPSFLSIFAYRIGYFWSHEIVKRSRVQRFGGVLLSFVMTQMVMVGAFIISYPFTTITRKMIMMGGESPENDKGDSKGKKRMTAFRRIYYSSTMDCVKKTFAEEGMKGFYQGGLCQFGKTILSAAIVSISNEIQGGGLMRNFKY